MDGIAQAASVRDSPPSRIRAASHGADVRQDTNLLPSPHHVPRARPDNLRVGRPQRLRRGLRGQKSSAQEATQASATPSSSSKAHARHRPGGGSTWKRRVSDSMGLSKLARYTGPRRINIPSASVSGSFVVLQGLAAEPEKAGFISYHPS